MPAILILWFCHYSSYSKHKKKNLLTRIEFVIKKNVSIFSFVARHFQNWSVNIRKIVFPWGIVASSDVIHYFFHTIGMSRISVHIILGKCVIQLIHSIITTTTTKIQLNCCRKIAASDTKHPFFIDISWSHKYNEIEFNFSVDLKITCKIWINFIYLKIYCSACHRQMHLNIVIANKCNHALVAIAFG